MTNNVATIYCWVKTPNDSRDCAGGTAQCIVPQKIAAKLAKQIDWAGDSGAAKYLEKFNLPDGHHLAVGHGVTIKYASGQFRSYRSD
jgi:hypothetical protein